MRIGFNAQIISGSDAGIATFAKGLIKNLILSNSRHELFFFGSPEFLNLENSDIIKLIPTSSFVDGGWKRILWEQFILPSKAKRHQVDIMFYPDHTGTIFRRLKKTVITIHDLSFIAMPETFPLIKRKYKTFALKQSIKKADFIISVSQATKNECVRLLNLPEEKIKVVYNGIDQSFKRIREGDLLTQARKKFGLFDKFILFVGTLEPRKNLVRLIRAYHHLRHSYHIEQDLVVAGRKGWLYSEIFHEVDRLRLKKHIHFLDYVTQKDLLYLYSLADLLVYPSLYEGFGFPPLEAMACETPVIASNISSMPEVLGDAAVLIDPKSTDEITTAMQKVLSDDALQKTLIERGLARVKLFSWQRSIENLLSIFEEIQSA